MENDYPELKIRLASAYRVLLTLGLFDYAGDASIRIPREDKFLIRGARVDINPTRMTSMVDTSPSDILIMDTEGKQLSGDLTPPHEVFAHCVIYRARIDVGGIVHAHAMMVTAFSIVGRTIEPVYARGMESTGNGLSFLDNPDPISTMELGEQLVSVLGNHRACMLRSHGLITVGSTLEAACLATINLEENAMMQWIATVLGEPKKMSQKSIERRQSVWDNPNMLSLVWKYYEEAVSVSPEIVRQRTAKNILRGNMI
jgi:ribulose-5-phosphate 4-epimerase/fuculose-1-phosphate aldolase